MGLIWHLALTTGSSSLLSLASLAGFLPIALFGILAGALVDRLPLKRVLIGTDLFIAAVGAALTIASLAGSLPAWLILIALFLRAVGTSFYTPASQSLTPHLAPPEHLVRLSGVTQAIQSGGYILGAALAAVIYPVAGITAMIVLDVLGALFASLAVLAAQIDAGGLDEADRSLPFSNKVRELFSEISDGYKLTRGYRGLLALLWCGFVFAFAFSPLAALFPIMTLGHFWPVARGMPLWRKSFFLQACWLGPASWRLREGSAIGRSPWSPRLPASALPQSYPDRSARHCSLLSCR